MLDPAPASPSSSLSCSIVDGLLGDAMRHAVIL